jgi:hypothetical protein
MIMIGSPASIVTEKKHIECFNVGTSDGKNHPFNASRFDR